MRTEEITAWAHAHPVRKELLDRFGVPRRSVPVPVEDRFATLARSIAYQQLAGAAASAIWARVEAGLENEVCPQSILDSGHDRLRNFGLSNAKAATLLALAEAEFAGVLRFARIGRLGDEEIVAHLSAIRGVGPWTAHMFLISALGREDVWPTTDYGVRAGIAQAFAADEMPTPSQLAKLGESHRPYRTTLAKWAWMTVDQGL